MTTRLHGLLVLLLTAHAVAHLPGFLAAWRLVEFVKLPYATTIVGGMLDIGPGGTRVVGVLWLVAAAGSAVAAVAVLLRVGWAPQFTWTVLAVSTVLCILGWPATRLGLLANLAVAGLFFLALRSAPVISALAP